MTSATVLSVQEDSAELQFEDGSKANVPTFFLPRDCRAGTKVMLVKDAQEKTAKDALNELLGKE